MNKTIAGSITITNPINCLDKETIEELNDKELIKDIKQARQDFKDGKSIILNKDE